MTQLPVPIYALVIEQEKRTTKNGDYFWQNALKTCVGNIKSLMWNAPSNAEESPLFPHTGDIIEITGYDDQFAERGSIVIRGFHRLTKETLPQEEHSILEFEKASDEEMRSALNLISDSSFWDDEKHHKFTMQCLSTFDVEKLRACPAAGKVHHNYGGGLIVHTSEVLDLCRAIADASKRYSFINRDALFSGAILHDLGKVETYYLNDMGIAETLPTERSIGHLFYGMELVSQEKKKLQGDSFVTQDWVNEVLHLIASHHGLPEWGSVKTVQSVEAGILSRADYISSRNGMIETNLKEAIKAKQPLQDSFRIYGDSYFASIGMKEYVERAAHG